MLAGEWGALTLEDGRRIQHQTPPPKAILPVMRTKSAYTWKATACPQSFGTRGSEGSATLWCLESTGTLMSLWVKRCH